MTTGPGAVKVCTICGEDCSHRPRTKDALGRYYCNSCYEQAARQRHALREKTATPGGPGRSTNSPPPRPRPSPPDAGAIPDASPFALAPDNDLLDEIIQQAAPPIVAPPVVMAPCENCGLALPADAVICTNCGYNLQTHRKLKVRQGSERASDAAASTMLTAPLDLFFRPARFFRAVGAEASGWTVALAMWMYGIVHALDRIQTQITVADAFGRDAEFPQGWSLIWGASAIIGFVIGGIAWFIHGWWYRIRIGWSGTRLDDSSRARRVFAMTTFVISVPWLFYYIVLTASHDDASSAFASGSLYFDLVPIIAMYWSLWTSYAAVRTVFSTRPLPTAFWIVGVPAIWYAFFLAVSFLVGIAAVAVAEQLPQPPDVRSPQVFTNEVLGFHYPGNWTIDTTHPDYDPYSQLWIASADGACGVAISFYQAINTPEEELQATMLDLRRALQGGRIGESFSQWGGFSGHGSVIAGRTPDGLLKHRVFVTEAPPGWILEIVEIMDPLAEGWSEPGLQLIRDSFREPTPQQPERRRRR